MKKTISGKSRRAIPRAARAKKPKHSLVWHMQRLRGLKIERNRELVRELQW